MRIFRELCVPYPHLKRGRELFIQISEHDFNLWHIIFNKINEVRRAVYITITKWFLHRYLPSAKACCVEKLGNRFWFCCRPKWLIAMLLNDKPCVLNSTTKHAKSESITILTRFSLENEEKIMLDYFNSQQSKTAHALIVNFNTILAFFVLCRKITSSVRIYINIPVNSLFLRGVLMY